MTLVAHPDPGWTLGGWSGACTGTGTCTVSMDAAKSVNADFLPPPPTPGSTANLSLASGTVLFKEPSSEDTVHLEGAAQVPIGTEVDTTDGVAKVTVARGATLDTSEFYDGDFTVLQPGPKALGELRLEGGNFLDCVSSFRALREEAPAAPPLGERQGPFQDSRPLLVGDRARDEVADRGSLRLDPDHGRPGHGARARLRPQRRRQRPGGTQLPRQRAAARRPQRRLHHRRHGPARLPARNARE